MKIGDKVKLRDDVLSRHSRSVPAHCGFTREQREWRESLEKCLGLIGIIERTFENSNHVNVKIGGLPWVIGIDSTELVPVE